MLTDALKSITILGFKSIASIEDFELRPINILIGANGSGKSNLIQTFLLVRELANGRLAEYVGRAGGADRLLYFGRKVTPSVSITLRFISGGKFVTRLTPTDRDGFDTPAGSSFYMQPLGEIEFAEGNLQPHQVVERSSALEALVAKWGFHHFHDTSSASPLKSTANVNDNRFLRADGSNLAAYLFLLKSRHADGFDQIQRTVRLVAPFFDSFILEPSSLNELVIRLQWRHKGSDADFDVSAFSDGTLRFIALATLLLQPAELRPTLAIIDEPELGLHPDAIALLAAMIRQASTSTQLIVATQSPLLLDYFDPEDIVVATRDDGKTILKRLEREPLRTWLEEYSLGQLWEKNEIGGNPVAE